MDISGTYTLSAPREHVWSALRDPDTLRRTIPGCERLERADDGSYNVRLNVGVAAVKGVYDGKLRLTDLDPPARYRIVVDGKGLRGVLHGDGVLTLDAPDANTTVVSYQGTALLGGALAGVGNRLAGGAASMLIKSYFAKLGETVGAAGVADVASAPAMAAAPTAMPSAPVEPAPPAVAPAPAAAMPAAAMPEPPPAPAPAAPIMSVAPEPLENLAAAMPAPASVPPPPAPDVASAPSAASPAREPEPVGASVFAAPSSASSAADAARQRSWWRRLFGR
ncbi:MAG TPA: carbon monoxide dehydrogenase subunit G [Ktedonobacterales bacterium]|nr:carbon monoxide dehydrogenase subunit G [Ktedonobacterales bacterium]